MKYKNIYKMLMNAKRFIKNLACVAILISANSLYAQNEKLDYFESSRSPKDYNLKWEIKRVIPKDSEAMIQSEMAHFDKMLDGVDPSDPDKALKVKAITEAKQQTFAAISKEKIELSNMSLFKAEDNIYLIRNFTNGVIGNKQIYIKKGLALVFDNRMKTVTFTDKASEVLNSELKAVLPWSMLKDQSGDLFGSKDQTIEIKNGVEKTIYKLDEDDRAIKSYERMIGDRIYETVISDGDKLVHKYYALKDAPLFEEVWTKGESVAKVSMPEYYDTQIKKSFENAILGYSYQGFIGGINIDELTLADIKVLFEEK